MICREIIDRGLQVRLRTMGVNPARVTTTLVDLMQQAGFTQIDSTPDSASPTMLANLGKNFSLADLRNTAKIIKAKAMPTMWFFLLGGPGENEQTLTETFAFIDDYVDRADMVHITEGLRIFPNTALYDQALKMGTIKPHQSLLSPHFFVEPTLGAQGLSGYITQATKSRPNCIPASASTPSPSMIKEASRRQREGGCKEPMFRTLLRLRRENWPT